MMEPIDERLRILALGLTECNINDAVIIFEHKTEDGVAPNVMRIGSPMACLALTEWAARYQYEEQEAGFDLFMEEDDQDEV